MSNPRKMNKRQNIFSSKEAATTFKRDVDKSLHLLGFLNSTDKQDVWKYWKAVSSAVKIAVNGNGSAISSPPGNYGGKFSKEKKHKCNPQDVITLCVPLSHNDKSHKRSRILGIVNQQVADDYIYNEVKYETESDDCGSKVSIEDSSQLRSISTHLINQICQLGDYSIKSETSVLINDEENSNKCIDTCATSGIESSTFEKVVTRLSPQAEERSVNDLSPVKIENPAICDNNENDPTTCISLVKGDSDRSKNHSDEETKTSKSVQVSCCQSHKGDLNTETDNSCDVESKAVFQVTDVVIRDYPEKGGDENHGIVIVNDSSPETEFYSQTPIISSTNDAHPGTATSDLVDSSNFVQPYEVRVKFADSDGDDDKQMHNNMITDCSQLNNSIEEPQQIHKSSDIETIISALEEELKKTSSSSGIHSISITSSDNGDATVDIHASSDKEDIQKLSSVAGNQEIVLVQNVEDVIWNPSSDGSVQVLNTSSHAFIDEVQQVATTSADDEHVDGSIVQSSIDTQYDVVEYEVQAEKGKSCRGVGTRKRKKEKDLNEEESTMKSKDDLDRTCPMCHRVLTYASSMAAHMRIHTGDRPYSCGQCDRKFTTKANRDRHEATHVGLKPFKCMECDKSFTEKRSLKIHMRSHTGERPFVCTLCHRGFAQKCTLMVHMDRHLNKKGHLCDLCGKAFRQKSQLDVHVKRHNRQANFPCPECKIKCYTKGDLDRHMMKHTGERPFTCSVCSKTFTRKQYLADHENSHYGRKPYKCSVCAMSFYDMGSCYRHVKKHREQDESSEKGENSCKQEVASILTVDDYDSIIKDSQAGKLLTLKDGTQALVTAVDTDADGVTVYHVTCVHDQPDKEDTVNMTTEENIISITSKDDASTVQDLKNETMIS